jgi:endonuclease YncB( thermonuclease family)
MRHPSNHANGWAVAVMTFALGVIVGAVLRPTPSPQALPRIALATARTVGVATPALAGRLDPGLSYPAEVLRIIDGDTFEARVRVWPGLDVDTKVRLRGIDAAELHARCSDELAKAQAARTALQTILAEGGVTISRVGVDKYGGRVDAAIATRNTADVSAAMLNGGWARSYDGRKRGSWCG